MGTTQVGTHQQCWMSTVADYQGAVAPQPLLIRDDAFSETAAVFGRQLRLGEPINLGARSTWRIDNFEGGRGQLDLKDPAMYYYSEGGLDVSSEKGRMRLWGGMQSIITNPRRAVTRYTVHGGANAYGGNLPLYLGECNALGKTDPDTSTSVPPSGFKFMRYRPDTDSVTDVKTDFTGSINSISRINDQGTPAPFLLIGCGDGDVWLYNEDADTFSDETADYGGVGIEIDSMAPYLDATFFLAGNKLYKREWNGSVTYTAVKTFNAALTCRGLTVWNNRLYMGVIRSGNISSIYYSDGVNTAHAFTFPEDFEIRAMVPHYGSLYIVGQKPGSVDSTGVVGQVWRYTGSSIFKVYESGSPVDNLSHQILDVATWGKYVVWSRSGPASERYGTPAGIENLEIPGSCGVVMYDAEQDAIVDGPKLITKSPSGTNTALVDGILNWNGTLVFTAWASSHSSGTDSQPAVVAYASPLAMYQTVDVGSGGGTYWDAVRSVTGEYISSNYKTDVPGEDKVWLELRVRYKVLVDGAYVSVNGYQDENRAVISPAISATFGGSYTTGEFVTERFDLSTSNGAYPRSKSLTISARLNSDTTFGASSIIGGIVIDFIEVDYVVAPAPKRQWRIRVLATDSQVLKSGSNNTLTTGRAIIDYLRTKWRAGDPVVFYPPIYNNAYASSDEATCIITDFLVQQWQKVSDTDSPEGEVSLTLVEI